MSNTEIKDKFLNWVGSHLEEQREKLRKYCSSKRLEWDSDIFSETILKTAEKILKHGLTDCSEKGMEAYLFMAFKMNTKREKQYSRNARRDKNIENLNELWESYCNENMSTSTEKLLSDLRKDFSAIYILSRVEDKFGSSLARLFTLKYYNNLTYKELQRMHPQERKLRDSLLEAKRWCQEHISKDEVDKAFAEQYADIID